MLLLLTYLMLMLILLELLFLLLQRMLHVKSIDALADVPATTTHLTLTWTADNDITIPATNGLM